MDKIDELLMYVQKTNPGMTREKLIDELNKKRLYRKSFAFYFGKLSEKFSITPTLRIGQGFLILDF